MTGSSEFDEKWVDFDWTSNTRREGKPSSDLSDDRNSGVDGGSIAGDGEKHCSSVRLSLIGFRLVDFFSEKLLRVPIGSQIRHLWPR